MPFPYPGRARPAVPVALAFGLAIGTPHPTDGKAFVRAEPPVRTAVSPAPGPAAAPETPATAEGEVPFRVTLGAGGRDLFLEGDLTEGTAARVAAMLKAHPRVARIHLSSDGGLVDEASAIARLVTARRLSTSVSDACISACTLIFVHGRRRFLAAGGQLGFHAPYEEAPDGRMLSVDPAPERAAYRAAGVPRAFVARIMTVAPADIWIPSPGQLRAAGIVTELVTAAGPRAPLKRARAHEASRTKGPGRAVARRVPSSA
ncbi:hypothetical protein [Methylobacterium sp. J-076]|uniref:COG3904 family protein n=1 Tax=Methylobacterium sp. J-076 TaxID=2836655 RepID=UPI001FBC1439|nr:hypothetical protein [Methylobacterium sp. J-076]MCJ2012197.1 hypothetical protein [Methylobacterium sp. J-076]